MGDGEGGSATRNFRRFGVIDRLQYSTIFDQNPPVPEGPKLPLRVVDPPRLRVGTPPHTRGRPHSPSRGRPPPLCASQALFLGFLRFVGLDLNFFGECMITKIIKRITCAKLKAMARIIFCFMLGQIRNANALTPPKLEYLDSNQVGS